MRTPPCQAAAALIACTIALIACVIALITCAIVLIACAPAPCRGSREHVTDPFGKLMNGRRTMVAAMVHQYDRCACNHSGGEVE